MTFFVTSCSDDDNPDDTQGGSNDGWISNLGLDSYSGELVIRNTDEYLVAGNDYILKVDVNGNVTQEIQDPFSQPAMGLFAKTKIFDDKVYRITSIGFGNTDATQKMELEIYDNNGNLLESTELEATNTLIDVIIESNKITLLTWNWNDSSVQGASTHVFQVDYDGQLLFDKNLTSFPNVQGRVFDFIQLEDGNFLFEYNKTLYKVGPTFDPISTYTSNNTIHHFIEGPSGNIYAGGHMSATSNYLLKLDANLNMVNETSFDNALVNPIIDINIGYAVGGLAVDGDHVYCMEVAYEYGQELRIQCYDQNLNHKNEFVVEGSGPRSDLMINELGSVSFLYGNPYADFEDFPDTSVPTEARLYKINLDCGIPETIVNN